jgi:hypothetical protein
VKGAERVPKGCQKGAERVPKGCQKGAANKNKTKDDAHGILFTLEHHTLSANSRWSSPLTVF